MPDYEDEALKLSILAAKAHEDFEAAVTEAMATRYQTDSRFHARVATVMRAFTMPESLWGPPVSVARERAIRAVLALELADELWAPPDTGVLITGANALATKLEASMIGRQWMPATDAIAAVDIIRGLAMALTIAISK